MVVFTPLSEPEKPNSGEKYLTSGGERICPLIGMLQRSNRSLNRVAADQHQNP
jgi:hypothetical protein